MKFPSLQDSNKNVRIHCTDRAVVRTSHFFLACASKFLRSLFGSSPESSYDLVCPGFEPGAVEKVLALVSGRSAVIDPGDSDQIRFILSQLKIEIRLPAMPSMGPAAATYRDTKPSLHRLFREASQFASIGVGELGHCDLRPGRDSG